MPENDKYPHYFRLGKIGDYELIHAGDCPYSEVMTWSDEDGDVRAVINYLCLEGVIWNELGVDAIGGEHRLRWLDAGLYRVLGWMTEPGMIEPNYGLEFTEADDNNRPVPVPELSISKSITMRPVWRRRQRRLYLQTELEPPTEIEQVDAIKVLEDPENETFAPALWFEAFAIVEEASR